LIIAGPIVGWLIAALETAVVVGGLSAIGAGLYGLGIPKDSILKYETALKTDKYVLIVHGTAAETTSARNILSDTGADSLDEHIAAPAHAEPILAAV
jgi:hypothetical protein